MRFKKQNDNMAVITDNMTLFSRYNAPGGTHLPYGNRRVYSTKWRTTWMEWERDNGTVDHNGSYLTCIRPRDNGVKRRVYLDMSMAHIEIDNINLPSFNPLNTKYMSTKYRGHKGLTRKDLAEMIPSKLERFIESLSIKRTNPRKGRKRR